MVGLHSLIGVVKRQHCIVEDLLISESPIAEKHHKDWRPFESLDCCGIKFVIIHWWLLKVVSHQDFLTEVQVEECKSSNWIKNWKRDSIHECHENRVEYCCVLKMHKMFRTAIQGDVLLLSYAFGLFSFAETATPTIKEAENAVHADVRSEVNVNVH